MNWDDYRILDAAASMGSLSAGAQSIGMSQPQVSRRLRELERDLGVRLFDRTPYGLRPTDAGTKLIPMVAKMRMAADAIERAKPDLSAGSVSVVRISVDEIREHFLVSHLSEIRTSLDGIELEIFAGHEHLDHESRMTDIQIRSCLPDNESLIAKRVGTTGYGLYAAKSFLERQGVDKDYRAVSTLPWIGLSPDHLWYPLQRNLLESVFETASALRFNSMTGIVRAAALGHGVALLPHFMASELPDLKMLQAPEAALETTEYLIVHRDLTRETAIRKVIDALSALYKDKRKELAATN